MFPFTIRQLELFSCLSETGSFQQTADKFGISQPSVSNQISVLELQLGIDLFHRERGKSPTLTRAGSEFRSEVENFLALGRKLASHKVAEMSPVRRLRIYVGGHIFHDFIKAKLTDFYADNPYLVLDIAHERPRPQLILDMERGKFDVAVFNHWDKLELPQTAHIGRIRAGVFAHPSLAHATGDPEAISQLPFLLPPARSNEEEHVSRWLAAEGIVPTNIVAHVTDHEVARAMMRQRACASFGIETIFPRSGGFVALHPVLDWTCHFFARQDLPGDIVETLRAFIVACLPLRT